VWTGGLAIRPFAKPTGDAIGVRVIG